MTKGLRAAFGTRNECIEQYKNRVTIDASFVVDTASKVHAAKDDASITVFAKVYDKDCELVVRKRRMAFIKDSPAENKVKTLVYGDTPQCEGP